jgi:hypothetical protein
MSRRVTSKKTAFFIVTTVITSCLKYCIPISGIHQRHWLSFSLCKIWGFQGGDYEECRLLGYKNPVRTSQETHYVSATETSPLMLCKIWCFHGSDYEEWRLLGYRNPVRNSRRHVSTTEFSQLMLCKIWGFHCDDYEECRLLGCDTEWIS